MAIKTTDFTWKELGVRIRQRRIAHNLPQQALADAAGLTQNAIYRLEAGETNPQLTTLQTIAPALGCTVRELLCGLSDGDPRMAKRFARVRRVIESGDEAALRILDHGIEAAETLINRAARTAMFTGERKLIMKGDRRLDLTDGLILNQKPVRARSEVDDILRSTPEYIKVGGKVSRRSKETHDTK
jgi:transcriptional regulator with XRE-family HTH domain